MKTILVLNTAFKRLHCKATVIGKLFSAPKCSHKGRGRYISLCHYSMTLNITINYQISLQLDKNKKCITEQVNERISKIFIIL